MVSLATAEPKTLLQASKTSSLRESAFWYPRIPENHLLLHDNYLAAKHQAMTGYLPLRWIDFGGPNGIHLHHLIQVVVQAREAICSVGFDYNTEHVPRESRFMGLADVPRSQVQRFKIDGPKGERIDGVEIYSSGDAAPRILKVSSTNGDIRVRKAEKHSPLSCHLHLTGNANTASSSFRRTGAEWSVFGKEDSIKQPDLEKTDIQLVAGSTVTGFYCVRVRRPHAIFADHVN